MSTKINKKYSIRRFESLLPFHEINPLYTKLDNVVNWAQQVFEYSQCSREHYLKLRNTGYIGAFFYPTVESAEEFDRVTKCKSKLSSLQLNL